MYNQIQEELWIYSILDVKSIEMMIITFAIGVAY